MRSRAEITLGRAPEAARHARRFVDGVCANWHLADVVCDAEVVASELVENTLQHTDSAPCLSLEFDRETLTVAVADESGISAHVRPSGADGGFGLVMVARTASAWGCTPSAAGGKTVWARLHT